MKTHKGTARRYAETIRRLRPEQIVARLWQRLLSLWPWRGAVIAPEPLPLVPRWGPRVPRCPASMAGDALAAAADELAGRFRSWGRERRLDLRRPWEAPDLGRSWNYPVHYFEALPGLLQGTPTPPRVAALCAHLERWIEAHPPGTGCGWEPYPTALRIVSWLDLVHGLGERAPSVWRQRILGSIYSQSAWLQRRLERHLLGTHLLKDVKALLVAATVFDDREARRWRAVATPLLLRELRQHVSAEGAHSEPSFMYHCTALEDLLDLLNFESALGGDVAAEVRAAAARMLAVAVAVQTPAGGYPLRGDAWDGGAATPAALSAYAARLGLEIPVVSAVADRDAGARLFADAGVVVWQDPSLYLLADVADIGPPHLSAHGHCDSLSFELWCGGVAFLVDSGTWSYEAGEARQACRGTRAHNTLEIDGREQHEIWAAFRVARRSKVRVESHTGSSVRALLVPWYDERLRVRRQFEFAPGQVRITDRVEGPGVHEVVNRLHLHPDCIVEPVADTAFVLRHGRVRLALDWRSDSSQPTVLAPPISNSSFASGAGELRPNGVLQLRHSGPLPFASVLTLRAGT